MPERAASASRASESSVSESTASGRFADSPDGAIAGDWWHCTDEPGRLVCDLCPRTCALRPGDRGFCFVRENRGGQMMLTTYGRSTGFCIDPIEKKPLNHFYPGTSVLSFGTAGCNLGCKFCQNWSISKSREIAQLSEHATGEMIAEAAARLGCRSVAFTYNDPVIWAEYAIDVAQACHERGIKTVAVTAGYITAAARKDFFAPMDAANVDLKAFTETFYQHLTLSHLEPVLETLVWLKQESDVWFELTNLVIPGENDSSDEFRRMCDWILERLGPDVPLHFTAFHPDFRLRDRPPTPVETLLRAHDLARAAGLHYVYVGNVHDRTHQSTYCPGCGHLLIERDWYQLGTFAVDEGRCSACGQAVAGRFDARPGGWGARRLPVRIAAYAQPESPPAGGTLPLSSPNPPGNPMSTPPDTADPRFGAPAEPPPLLSSQEDGIARMAARIVAATAQRTAHTAEDDSLEGAARIPVMGSFVSLKRRGHLRSCVGFLGKSVPLAEAVAHAARRAATEDHRFPPISPNELYRLDLEVWLLYAPQRVAAQGEARLGAVTIGRHGLQIEGRGLRGLLLPAVAVEHGFDAEEFLGQVSRKAGLPPDAWKQDDTTLFTFEGRAISRAFREAASLAAPLKVPPRFNEEDLAALGRLCRQNVQAILSGATPSYYQPGAIDGQMAGAALWVHGDGGVDFTVSRLSLRPGVPLQSTLFSLAEGAAEVLRRRNVSPQQASALRVELALLDDPVLHGTAADADLDDVLPDRRALLVVDRLNSAWIFDRHGTPRRTLDACVAEARLDDPARASVYSLASGSTSPRISAVNVTRAVPDSETRRPAAVAGRFYPADERQLAAQVDACFAGESPPAERWSAVMVPHAGLVYSGRIAASALRQVEIPETAIVLGPKHTPYGVQWAVAPHRNWALPGATIASDPLMARRLVAAVPGFQLDAAAHRAEHAIEVELPLLARLAPEVKVVGVAIGGGDLSQCLEFGAALAEFLASLSPRPLLVISSDMNHFATDAENRRLDEMALAAMESLDPAALYHTVRDHGISMCGVLPAVIVMEALRKLGGLARSRRTGYATSADTSGDTSRVVGYAGMLLD